MRLFLAIKPDEKTIEQIGKLQEEIDTDLSEIRLLKPEQIHLTLKFLGEVDNNKLVKVIDCLNRIRFTEFSLELNGVGVFPDEAFIRIIWVGLGHNRELLLLQEQIDNGLHKIGFARDRKFHPHITIARVKFLKEKVAFLKNIRQLLTPNTSFIADKIILYKSTLTKQGPLYNAVKSFSCENKT
ncbi:RNA 2',3'-cyclic phosphodiesterase [Candidatus Woesearchaeota archaeon]|nr:RNA 2',3'-cyclic phosphodiesterase [Candidatus Woesearchaeota archaeon]